MNGAKYKKKNDCIYLNCISVHRNQKGSNVHNSTLPGSLRICIIEDRVSSRPPLSALVLDMLYFIFGTTT